MPARVSDASVANAVARPAPDLARPKSSTFTSCRDVIIRLALLMSRWTMPQAVRLVERVGDLHRDVEAVGHRQRPAGDARGEQLALDVLHRDEEAGLVLDQVVGHGDVRRAQQRGGLRLAHQARARFGVGVERGGEELERDLTAEPRVFREVDLAHAAAAEAFDDAVLEDGRSEKACAARHDSIIVPQTMATLVRTARASGARSASSSASRSAAASSARPPASRRACPIRC